jgi:carboxylesterase
MEETFMEVAERPPLEADIPARATRRPAGVVLIHGFNGTPGDMAELGARLARHGYGVHVVRLPGHAGRLSEMAAATWTDWHTAAVAAAQRALARYDRVIVVGHSLGGALALAVAAEEPRIAGVVSLCPPCQPRRRLPETVGVLQRFVRYVPAVRYDVNRTWADRWQLNRTHAYDWVPLSTVQSLCEGLATLRDRLPAVRSPALVVCSRHDHVVPMEDGVEAYLCLGSAHKDLVVLSRSFHLVLQDCQSELVMERVRRFCAGVAPLPARP